MSASGRIYTAVLTRADGTAKNYESFADAWAAAMADSGSTLRLLCDVTLGEAEDGIIAGSGKFYPGLGGKTINLESYTSKIYDGKPIDVSKIDLYQKRRGRRPGDRAAARRGGCEAEQQGSGGQGPGDPGAPDGP